MLSMLYFVGFRLRVLSKLCSTPADGSFLRCLVQDWMTSHCFACAAFSFVRTYIPSPSDVFDTFTLSSEVSTSRCSIGLYSCLAVFSVRACRPQCVMIGCNHAILALALLLARVPPFLHGGLQLRQEEAACSCGALWREV